MNITLDQRLTFGFVFGLVGLTVELVGGLIGLPVSGELIGALSAIVIGTFGVGLIAGSRNGGRRNGNPA